MNIQDIMSKRIEELGEMLKPMRGFIKEKEALQDALKVLNDKMPRADYGEIASVVIASGDIIPETRIYVDGYANGELSIDSKYSLQIYEKEETSEEIIQKDDIDPLSYIGPKTRPETVAVRKAIFAILSKHGGCHQSEILRILESNFRLDVPQGSICHHLYYLRDKGLIHKNGARWYVKDGE